MLLEEITKNTVEKWGKYGLLEGLKNKHDRMITAVIMENQRLANENDQYTDTGHIAQFRRISIPLIRRIIPQLITNRIASVQPFLLENDKLSYRHTNANGSWMRNGDVKIENRKYKTGWKYTAQQNNLYAEAEMTAVLAQELTLEIDRRVLHELQQGVSTQDTWDFNDSLGDTIKEKYEALYLKLLGIFKIIGNKLGLEVETYNGYFKGVENGYFWIVTSPEVASIFESATTGVRTDFANSLGIQYCGTINMRFKLYKDSLFPTNKMLLGYRGDSSYESGFFFCPHILLQLAPIVLNPDTFAPERGFIGKSGFKMINPDYYATLDIENLTV